MDILQAIWLGVLQGLTEFLPISSSAHLILMRFWFGWEIGDPQAELVFDVALHVGTLTAIVVYFWKDLMRIAGAVFSSDPERAVDKRLAWGIVAGCIPAAIVGALFEDPIEKFFRSQYALIAGLLIGIGVLMAVVDRLGRKQRALESIGIPDAFLIGVAQACALIPGFSRSGITIIAGLMLGLQREAAARFSFLLATPITFGAAVWSFRNLFKGGVPSEMIAPMLAGGAAAMVVGWLCIAFLIRYLRTRSLMPFVVYRVAIGLATLGKIFWGG
ncbi:MAG: undecaprenyl-diphosphatase UppP [Fimbriimonadales bacterium]|nr:undecaprenyl-diphosphatase UppP [Fimbriimonadales bacterium]